MNVSAISLIHYIRTEKKFLAKWEDDILIAIEKLVEDGFEVTPAQMTILKEIYDSIPNKAISFA